MTRRTPVLDPDDHHLFVSLGCAAENLALAAAAPGRKGEMQFEPDDAGRLLFDFAAGPPERSLLFEAIPQGRSTRADYYGRPVSAADLATLATASQVPGVDLILLTERPQIERVLVLALAGNGAHLGAIKRHNLTAHQTCSRQKTMKAALILIIVSELSCRKAAMVR